MKKFLRCATLFGLVLSANIAQSLHASGRVEGETDAAYHARLKRNIREAARRNSIQEVPTERHVLSFDFYRMPFTFRLMLLMLMENADEGAFDNSEETEN